MTLERKTPKARREARSYCRRCLAVMLCCVLAFGLTVRVTPRARANAAVGTIGLIGTSSGSAAATGALATNPVGATIGGLLLVAAGVPFTAGYIQNEDSIFYGTAFYELGDDCYDYLYEHGTDIIDAVTATTVSDWLVSLTTAMLTNGGVAPGDTIDVPAAVAEAVRQWAITNIDFTSGEAVYTESGIFTDSGQSIVFTQFPADSVSGKNYVPSYLGTVVTTPLAGEQIVYQFTDKAGNVYRYVFINHNGDMGITRYYNGSKIKTSYVSNSGYIFYPYNGYLALDNIGVNPSTSDYLNCNYGVVVDSKNFLLLSAFASAPFDVSTTLTKTPALDKTKTQDMAVTVPADIPTTQVGGVTVPVVGTLTGEDLLDGTGTGEEDKPVPDVTPWDRILDGLEGIEGKVGTLPQDIAGAITDALPITGSVAGDQTVEQVMTEPDSLGALMITKFPFSIPWDIAKAIELLAAPPTPPKWEIDLFGPLQGKWGFHSEDTSLVIDFERLEPLAVVVRWVSTVMFVYALASATKRFIWTA